MLNLLMPADNLLEIQDYGWKLRIQLFEEKIKLTLIDESENKIEKIIKHSEFIIENAHNIGRELENQFNKSNNIILEPYNISKIIGLVDRSIKSMKSQIQTKSE